MEKYSRDGKMLWQSCKLYVSTTVADTPQLSGWAKENDKGGSLSGAVQGLYFHFIAKSVNGCITASVAALLLLVKTKALTNIRRGIETSWRFRKHRHQSYFLNYVAVKFFQDEILIKWTTFWKSTCESG